MRGLAVYAASFAADFVGSSDTSRGGSCEGGRIQLCAPAALASFLYNVSCVAILQLKVPAIDSA